MPNIVERARSVCLSPGSAFVILTTLLLASVVPQGAFAQGAFAQGATIEATPRGTALAGSRVTVKWSGPNGSGDYITVVRKGAGPFEYLDYRPTSDGRAPVNPVLIVMPAEPGAYEIRYVSSNPRSVLATVPYEVTAVAAAIDGPASVTPDSRFEVAWSGPNNSGDWVTIVASGAAPRAYGSYVDVRSGTTDSKTGRTVATLRAPARAGRYELRYVQQGTRVIGTRAIEVAAATSTGPSNTTQLTVSPVVPVLTIPTAQGPALTVATETALSTAPPPATTSTGSATPSSSQPAARSGSAAIPAGLSTLAGTTPTGGGAAGTVDLTQSMKTCTNTAAPQFSATPGGVTFTLTKPAGTTGYRISRRDVGELTPTPITAASYTHAAPLDYRQTYQYVITGVRSDGGCTTAPVSVTPPKPLTPQVTAKVTPGQVTGRVTLSWLTQNDRPTAYLVLGPGLTQAGTEVPASTSAAGHSFEIGNLAIGEHSWLVTPLWKSPAGTMSDVSLGARVTATVTGTSARFRVLLTGFRVNHETNAGTFGEHNAVYAAASVEVLNRQNNFAVVQQPVMVRSRVHGDTNRDPTRLRAGSASPTGGLLAGDAVPTADPAGAAATLPPSTTSFPLTIWEGSLTYGQEAVIVRPTLWVWNGGVEAFQEWSGKAMNQVGIGGGQLLRDRQLSTVKAVIARSELSFRSSTLFTCFMDPVNIAGRACAVGRDRPIGVTPADYLPDYNGWNDLVFVVTRETIENALASPYQAGGVPGGVVPIELVDNGPAWNGNYTMYLQVQRIP